MAILLRLRQAFLRSSSIPKNCFFPPIASHSSHLINLSKTLFPTSFRLENPSIRHTHSSNHDPETNKTQKVEEIDFVKFPKPSPEEIIQTCFQTLAKVLGSMEHAKGIQEISDRFKKSGLEMVEQLKCACIREKSVEDSKVIQEMTDKLKKSGLEMIEQLKDMLQFILVSPDLDIDGKDTKFEGENEVIIPRLSSPLTEYKNQLSVEDMEMIDEMPEKMRKYSEVLEKLKAMHGFTSHSRDFYIDCKKKKYEDHIEMARTARIGRKSCLSKTMLACGDRIIRLKDYIEMTETRHMPKESLLNIFSPAEISKYAAEVANLKAIHGPTWRSHVFNFDKFEGNIVGNVGIAQFDVLTYCTVQTVDATEHDTTHTVC